MKHKETTAHISEEKKKAVQDIAKVIDSYPVVAILNLESLPAKQLQQMQRKLRSIVEIRVAKKSVIEYALQQSTKKNITKLSEHMTGTTGLLLSKENPFRLYKMLKQSKSNAPIKAGQVSPKDITLPAGPTPFAPGPIIGELGMLKIKAGIEAGKVVIKQDAEVAKKGDVISPGLSSLLLRLGIEPMEIGLNLVACYENGEVVMSDVLDIDQDVFLAKLHTAATEAMNLAVDVAYPCAETIELLIQKAYRDSKAIALEQNILADAVIEQILAKADAQANAISAIVNK